MHTNCIHLVQNIVVKNLKAGGENLIKQFPYGNKYATILL